MTKNLEARVILKFRDDVGSSARSPLDETFTLDEYMDATPGRMLTLAADADDVAVTFTSACLLYIRSLDNKFSLRLEDGGVLLENLVSFGPLVSNAATNGCIDTSVLLTGNGSTTASLEIYIVESYDP